MEDAFADADFYINNGRNQPGCRPASNAACEHDRANDIWTSSLGWVSSEFLSFMIRN